MKIGYNQKSNPNNRCYLAFLNGGWLANGGEIVDDPKKALVFGKLANAKLVQKTCKTLNPKFKNSTIYIAMIQKVQLKDVVEADADEVDEVDTVSESIN